jgi:hypothetical protein
MRVSLSCSVCLALLAVLGFPTDALSQDRMQRLLGELSNASGPSGFEGPGTWDS